MRRRRTGKMILNIILSIAVLAGVCLSSNCGGHKDTGRDDVLLQWSAFAFDNATVPLRGEPGLLRHFAVQETVGDNDTTTILHIDGTYLGIERAQIETRRTQSDEGQPTQVDESVVVTTVECCKLQHRITVVRDELGVVQHPASVDITVWIPTADIRLSDTCFGVCVKAQYTDSDGETGLWSYYVDQAMRDQANAPPQGTSVEFAPCSSGSFRGFDESALYGLYGMPLQCLGPLAEGESSYLAEMTYTATTNEIVNDYKSLKVLRSFGTCDFDSWEVSLVSSGQGMRSEMRASLCADLPIPFYISLKMQTDTESSYIECMLEDLTIG